MLARECAEVELLALEEKEQELLQRFRIWDDEALGSSEPFKGAGKGILKQLGCMLSSCRVLTHKIDRSVNRRLRRHQAA